MTRTIIENLEKGGGGQQPHRSIREIHEVQRGQEAPHNGNTVLPKNVHVTPFSPEGLINPILNIRFLGGRERSNGLLGGHPDFDNGHPSLLEDFYRGILVIEVFSTPLKPKEVENEVVEDVEQLLDVRKALDVVALGKGGGVFSFRDGFGQ
jgi:hypothetical protein